MQKLKKTGSGTPKDCAKCYGNKAPHRPFCPTCCGYYPNWMIDTGVVSKPKKKRKIKFDAPGVYMGKHWSGTVS